MSLASPIALLWLAAVVPVVAFYILKIRLRRVPVSTTLFWRQIYDENQPRSIWQRMRHWVSLLAQILMLLLLVGALTDPYFAWETRQLRRIVLVVDNSASMNGTDVSPTRLAAAKTEAGRVIGGMRFRDELAVVTAGGPPQVACGFSSHGRTLATSVSDVSPTDNPTRVEEAVELAQRLLGERADDYQREIVVLTDVATVRFDRSTSANGQAGSSPSTSVGNDPHAEGPAVPSHRETRVVVRRLGTNVGNVGITRFQVRRSLVDPLGYEILAEVTNASDESVECRLEIDLNEDVVDVVPLKLTPGQRWSQSFEKTSADGGQLLAKLDRADVLAADNQAWAVLPKREPIPVTLVTEGNLFLQKVFESNPLVALTQIPPANLSPVAEPRSTSTDSPPVINVTVLHRHVPEKLPSGPTLVIDPRGSCDAWQIGEPLQNPLVSQQDRNFSASLLSHVRLDNVVMPEARQIKFTSEDGVKVLARSISGDPLLAIIERPGTKVLLLTVNLDEGDLPLRTAFPILMTNALNWFTENRGDLREALPTGAITEIDVASLSSVASLPPVTQNNRATPAVSSTAESMTQRNWMLVAPDGRRFPQPKSSERLTLGPFDQCGVWQIIETTSSGDERAASENEPRASLELAVNLMDRAESDVRVSQSDNTAEQTVASASLFGNHPFWFWLVAVAWLLMAVEWWAYQRRVIE